MQDSERLVVECRILFQFFSFFFRIYTASHVWGFYVNIFWQLLRLKGTGLWYCIRPSWHGCGMYVYYDVTVRHISDVRIWPLSCLIFLNIPFKLTCHKPRGNLTRDVITDVISNWEYWGKPILHNTTRSSLMSAQSYSIIQKDLQCQPSVDLLLIMRDR